MIKRFCIAAAFLFSLAPIHAQVLVEPIAKKPKAAATPAAAAPAGQPAEAPTVVQATATDEIKALAGKTVTVEGKVTRIGSTSGGGITFLNMAPGANSFVALVFKPDAAAFPDGFDKYKDQTLRVTGPIVIFKETTPEIVLKSPTQIEIVPTAAQ